ncbi:DUF4912 domain-containing protein [bacterium]|nr:DUF4912 domain-containing protein [bacterium]
MKTPPLEKIKKEDPVSDDDMAHFPVNYGENYLYILEVDPNHVHVFWEVVPETIPENVKKGSACEHDLTLRFYNESQEGSYEGNPVCLDIFVNGYTNDRFITFDDPPSRYYAELGYYDNERGVFIPVCCSNHIETEVEEAKDISNSINNIELKRHILNEKLSKRSRTPAKQDEKKPETFEADIIGSKKHALNINRKERPGDKIDASGTTVHAKEDASAETGGTLDARQGEESDNKLRSISEKDIIEYYMTISDRMMSEPDFSPWRPVLESMSSEETLKTLWVPGTFEVCGADPLTTESHFSSLPSKSK